MKAWFWIALGLLGSMAPPLAAQDSPPLPVGFSELISLDLVDAKASEVFSMFGQITGTHFVVEPAVTRPVNVRLQGVRVRMALDVLCESLGCRWTYFGPGAGDRVVVAQREDVGKPGARSPASLDQPLDLSLKEADVKSVLASFGQLLSAEVMLADVGGSITLELKSQPARAALDAICKQVGCRWQLLAGQPPTLRVVKP